MVRIPVYDDQRPLNIGSDTFRTIDTGHAQKALSHGLGEIAQGLETAAGIKEKENLRDDAFKAKSALNDYVNTTQADIEKRLQNGELPQDGKGFHDKLMPEYVAQAQKLLDSLPESQRQDAELRLQGSIHDLSNNLAKIERKQNRDFVSNVAQGTMERITNSTKAGMWDMPRATAEIDGFLKDTGLPQPVQEQFRDTMLKAAQTSRIEYLRTQHPEAFVNEFQKYLPNGVSDKALPIQKIIATVSKQYGVDPRQLLITAQIESGNNFYAGYNRPDTHIKGLFQFNQSERRRFALQLGTTPDAIVNDPATAVAAMALLHKEQVSRLEANGVPATPQMIYASHLLGQAGAIQFFHADPNTDAAALFRKLDPKAYAMGAFQQNGNLMRDGMTTSQVLGAIGKFVDGGARKVDSIMVPSPNVDPKAPVEIMGEKFDKIQAADIIKPLMLAQQDVVKKTMGRLDANAQNQPTEPGVANAYDSVWRSAEDKKEKDQKHGEKMLLGDNSMLAYYHSYAENNQYLPAGVVSAARKMVNSTNNPTLQQKGYELLATLAKVDPINGLKNAKVGGDQDSVGQNDAAKIRDYVAMTTHLGYGTDDQYKLMAIRQIEKSHSEDWKIKEQRVKKDIDEKTAQRTYAEVSDKLGWEKGRFANWWAGAGFTPTDKGPATEALRNRMEDMYQQRFRYWYTDSGNTDMAKANAMSDLQRQFGMSRVNGQPNVSSYPPEMHYPPLAPLPMNDKGIPKLPNELTDKEVKQNYGYILDQMKADGLAAQAKDANGKAQPLIPKNLQKNLKDTDWFLTPTGTTKKDVEAGRPPRYELGVKVDGKYVRIRDDWAPDPALAKGVGTTGESRMGHKLLTPFEAPDTFDPTDTPSDPSVGPGKPVLLDDKQSRRDQFRLKRGQ